MRTAPDQADTTPEEKLLAPINNPWRRALVTFCRDWRSRRDIGREFVGAGKNQLPNALKELNEAGWLWHKEETDEYTLSPIVASEIELLLDRIGNLAPYVYEDDAACDACIAALRRQSCRAVYQTLEQEGVAMLRKTLRDHLLLEDIDTKVACTILTSAYAIREVRTGLFETTGDNFSALKTWLDELMRAPA